MAKPAAPAASPPSQEVVASQANAVPDYLIEETEKSGGGRGVSTDSSDNIVPLLYVLQPLSPQVDENSSAHISEARAGDIWLRNYSPKEIVRGEEGVLFQPCYFWKDWVEWVPRDRGGGLVAVYPDCPKAAKEVPDPRNPNKNIWQMPNGNEVRETRHHAGYIQIDEATAISFCINLTGTGHTVSKNWMFSIGSKRTPSGKTIDSFACFYRLKTRQRSNVMGKWFVLDVQDAGYVPAAVYERGRALHLAFVSGEKVAEEDKGLTGHADEAAPGSGELDKEIPF